MTFEAAEGAGGRMRWSGREEVAGGPAGDGASASDGRSRWSTVVVVVCLGLAVAGASFFLVRRLERSRRAMLLERDGTDRISVLRGRASYGCLFVESVASFYRGSQAVERDEFEAFVAPFPAEYASLQATEWVPRVADADRLSYEESVRAEGFADFEIVERDESGKMVRASRRDEYFPIHYVAPCRGNEAALGFDLGSEPIRATAIRRATDTGQMTATGAVMLIQEKANQSGVLLVRPLYRKGCPTETVGQRRANLAGFVVGAFRIGDLLDGALAGLQPRGVDVALYDVSEPGQGLLLAYHPSRTRGGEGSLEAGPKAPWCEYTGHLEVGGRVWKAVCTAAPAHVAARGIWQSWMVLGLALAMTGGLSANLIAARRRQARVLNRAGELTELNARLRREMSERRLSERKYEVLFNSSRDAIMTLVPPTWKFASANPATLEMFGVKTEEEFTSGGPWDFSPERQPDGTPSSVKAKEMIGKAMREGSNFFEWTHAKADGTEFPATVLLARCRLGEIEQLQATVRDTTESKRAEAALRESERKYTELVQEAADAVLSLDRFGNVVSYNPAAERLSGYTAEEMVGRHFARVAAVAAGSIPRALKEFTLCLAGQERPPFEITIVRKDGSRFVGEVHARRIRREGKTIGAQVTLRDITERKRTAEALARSNAELEQFAYVASHDLQEPLRMVTGYLGLLQRRYEGRLDADADEFIGFAADGAERMRQLINDLLSYSRVHTRAKAFEPTDCGVLMEEVQADLGVAIEESGAEVTWDALPTVMADGTQLRRVLQNLVGNALKFRGEERPRVHVSAEEESGVWRFSVRDNGIGIDPRHKDRVFVIFQRLHGRDKYPGTGMGLATVKKIVERHGGRTWVESKAGQGATFFFTVPAREERSDEQSDEHTGEAGHVDERAACGSAAG